MSLKVERKVTKSNEFKDKDETGYSDFENTISITNVTTFLFVNYNKL